MERTIAFLGWSPAQIRTSGRIVPPGLVVERDPEALSRGEIVSESTLGVVIGDRGLRQLDPRVIGVWHSTWGGELCLFAHRLPKAVRLRWNRAGFAPWFDDDRLAEIVDGWIARPLRPHVNTEQILRTDDISEEMNDLMEALDYLRACRTQDWADVAGIDRHRLLRYCRNELSEAPEDVLWRWFEAGVRVLRSQGATLDDIAATYGYANGASVHRAFSRRRRPIPPRRQGVPTHAVN